MDKQSGPIGIFDSGYGGLSIFKEIWKQSPQYDYIYLGDNARTPYGTRSFETVYQYTWECVQALFAKGCRLVILACNTASAKALRSIQQQQLPQLEGHHRVLGVIRPTTELIGNYTKSKEVGILATPGTVASESYLIEIHKFFPQVNVVQEACPMWVPLVENMEHLSPGADYFIKQHLDRIQLAAPKMDTLLLACTHYPLLLAKIQAHLNPGIQILTQGEIVANSLVDYLQRHPEMDQCCTQNASVEFLTTGSPEAFAQQGSLFFGKALQAKKLVL